MRILRRSKARPEPRSTKLGGTPPPDVPACDHCGAAMDFMAQGRLGDAEARWGDDLAQVFLCRASRTDGCDERELLGNAKVVRTPPGAGSVDGGDALTIEERAEDEDEADAYVELRREDAALVGKLGGAPVWGSLGPLDGEPNYTCRCQLTRSGMPRVGASPFELVAQLELPLRRDDDETAWVYVQRCPACDALELTIDDS